MPNNNERTYGEITFSLSVSLDGVDTDGAVLVEDLQLTLNRAISANERFLPNGVILEGLLVDYTNLYTRNDDDRREDYLMTTNDKL